MENETNSRVAFVQRQLPWIIAGVLLVVYLLTLSHWITFGGLPVLSKVLRWDWRPQYLSPLHYLLTYPIHLLPVHWQLIALNVFAAICSALTLALLARSVAILPHDRTRDQRALERSEYSLLSLPVAWLPPLLAVLVCGLQLTFWENSTVDLGESLDLLLFAYCVRCLLEYRIAQKESWLLRFALVYGLGMANNYAMIAFWPAFLVAVIWIMGRRFFNWRFLLKMLGCGVAGLSLYVLLPAVNSLSDLTNQNFEQMLRTYWSFQRNTILDFPRFIILLLGLTSLLPILFIGIRWPAQYGDISPLGNMLANLVMHIVHGLFLAACIYVAFDPAFSPRKLGHGWGFLPFYYLGALTVGYCSGYFLLVFGAALVKPWQHPSLIQKLMRKGMVALVWAALVAVPAGLVYKNLPELKVNHSQYLSQFGDAAAQCLPPQGGVVLSDDPYRLYSLEAALYRAGTSHKYILLDTESLSMPQYHRYLRQRYPELWTKLLPPSTVLPDQIDSLTLIRLLTELQRTNELYYLHPSFGYYFERFYLRPRGLVYLMQTCPTDSAENPPLTPEEIKDNEQYWQKAMAGHLAPLIKALRPRRADEAPNPYLAMVGSMYSRPLDYLGVQLQRSGVLVKAGEYFVRALVLDTNNAAAYINMEYNRLLQAGKRENPIPSEGAVTRLARYGRDLQRVLSVNGPFDEPNTCYALSQRFSSTRNYRQAAENLLRVVFFDPTNFTARLDLVNLYTQLRLPAKALEEINLIRTRPILKARAEADPVPLIQAEAWAYAVKNDPDTAKKILHAAQEKHPLNAGPFETEVQIDLSLQQPTNAMKVLERLLLVQTNNAGALIYLGRLKSSVKDWPGAIECLNRSLNLSPQNPMALIYRAIANLQLTNLDQAERDYKTLLAILPKPEYAVYWGLGEIYFQKKDARQALKYYEEFLKIVPAGSLDIKRVKDNIKVLKSGSF